LQDLGDDVLRLPPLGFVRARGGGVQRLLEGCRLLSQGVGGEFGEFQVGDAVPASSRASLR